MDNLLACLHDQHKSGFFGGPAFIQPIKSNLKSIQKALIGLKKPANISMHEWF